MKLLLVLIFIAAVIMLLKRKRIWDYLRKKKKRRMPMFRIVDSRGEILRTGLSNDEEAKIVRDRYYPEGEIESI